MNRMSWLKNAAQGALAVAGVLALSGQTSPAQGPPKGAVDITNAQVQAVLKHAPPKVDQTLRVVDMGNYAMSIAVIHRGPTGAGQGSTGTPPANPAAAPVPCGLSAAPAGAKSGPPGMIEHDDTVETYIVISGGGTLVTGGQIVKGRRSAPEDEVTTILNGPSCSGMAYGDIVTRHMGVGDISLIPEGVPHGWTDIQTEVTYLSIRPDMKKVLQHGYVNPYLGEGAGH
jgi:hypothetical protein